MKTLKEEQQRIFEIMYQMDKTILLTELNEKYLNKLLDKISNRGIESLTNGEKSDLEKLSNNQNIEEPTILRFTSAETPVIPKDRGLTISGKAERNVFRAFIRGTAEEMAQSEIPIFFEGDLSILDKPKNKQRLVMVLPSGEYECVSNSVDNDDLYGYFLILKSEEDNESR